MFKCSDMTLSYFYSELFICLGHLLHIGQKSVCFCVWNASRAIDKRAAKPGQHIFRHATSQWHFQRLSSPFRCTGKKKNALFLRDWLCSDCVRAWWEPDWHFWCVRYSSGRPMTNQLGRSGHDFYSRMAVSCSTSITWGSCDWHKLCMSHAA